MRAIAGQKNSTGPKTAGAYLEEEYLELLTSCQDTGNFGPMLEEYAKINNRVLENVLQDNTITDEEVRNAARNTLGVIQGSLRGYGKQGANSVDHIGTPPSFQKPDWLFSAERWLESHPNKTMEDMYLALEGVSSSGSNDQTLRVQGRDDIHEGVRKLLE